MGFRASRGRDDALLVCESIISKSLGFRCPVWVVSIDLTKVFDKIQYTTLFRALVEQNVDARYIELLKCVYFQPTGMVGEASCRIDRGVRQGDILSPLLFNCALESVMRRWRERLHVTLGLHIGNATLASLCYADDLLLFVKSFEEAECMIQVLVEELARAVLTINDKKTKILTTDLSIALRVQRHHLLSSALALS